MILPFSLILSFPAPEDPMNPELLQGIKLSDVNGLQDHEAKIRAFVEDRMTDECGLIYSHLNARTLKPWTAEELRDLDTQPIYNKERGDPAGQLAYEDSLMATGEYALSQVLRFTVTGDALALAAAAHPVYAILRVLYEGDYYERGFLPKPHGGMRKAAYSHEISPDQYIKCYVALRAYQPVAPPSLRKTIDAYLVAVADYFLNRNFMHPYRERTIVSPQSRPHCISIYIPSLCVAFNITGNKKYKDALSRFDPVLNDLTTGDTQVNFNICSLYVEGFHLALQEGAEDLRLREAIRKQWEMNVKLVADDGFGYESAGKSPKTSRVMRLAASAPIVDRYFPELQAHKTGLFILQKITDPKAMTYFTEFDPKHHPPGHRYLPESICETSVTSWLLAFWRFKEMLR
jgi:hypothetical protein